MEIYLIFILGFVFGILFAIRHSSNDTNERMDRDVEMKKEWAILCKEHKINNDRDYARRWV